MELTHMCGAGLFDLQVAGTSYRDEDIAAIARNAEGMSALVFCTALLKPEPRNPHDSSAVAVWIGAVHVGYVPRELAPRVMQLLPAEKRFATVAAVISKGVRLAGRARWNYRVELDVSLDVGVYALSPPEHEEPTRLGPERLADEDGWRRWRVWLDREAVEDVRVGAEVWEWKARDGSSFGYFADNAYRGGGGHRLMTIAAAGHQGGLDGSVEQVAKRFAVIRLRPSEPYSGLAASSPVGGLSDVPK